MSISHRLVGPMTVVVAVIAHVCLVSNAVFGQEAVASERAESEPMSLAFDSNPPSPGEPVGEEAVTESQSTSAPPYDLWTTKRATGDWGGVRTWMDDTGIDFSIIYVPVWQQNFRGGLETHNADDFNGDLRLNLYLDLDKMKLVPGGFFFIRGKSSYNNGQQANTGALTSTAYAIANGDHEFFLDKWWYGQRFFDDKIEFRIGKLLTPVDLFDTNAYAGNPWDQFLNYALCANPTVPHRKAMGAYLKIKPTDWFYFSTGAVDADEPDPNDCWSTDYALHGPGNYIGYWEFGLTPKLDGPNGKLPGNYRFGFHYDPRDGLVYRDTLGGVRSRPLQGDDVGFYASFDQLLWKENDDPKDKQGLGAFFRYGFAHRDINQTAHFWSTGASYQGLIPKRDQDVLAFGVGQSILSSQLREEMNPLVDRETVYEVYYAIQVAPWLIVSPDIQVITNPGGLKTARDALIGGIRAKISL